MHSHHHFLHFLRNRELNELYISIAIRAFAVSLIGVFIPIYFYQQGYSFFSIFLFYAIWSLTHLLFSIPSAKISSKLGLKRSILLSIPFLILFFFFLYTLENFNWPLPFLSIFIGLSTSLFWLSYHVDFAKFSNKKNRGKQVGFSKIIIAVFSVLGPIVGGIILTFVGFGILFIIVSVLLIGSVIPLFFSREIHEPSSFSLKGFFRGQKIKDILSYVGFGIEGKIGAVVWPLFIFIFIFSEKYLSLGLVSSLTLGVALVSIIFIGKFSDIYRRKILKIGSVFNAVIWIVKSFIITPVQVFITDAFYGVSRVTMDVPFDAINYDKAKEEERVKIIVQREMYTHLGIILLFLVLMFFTESLIEIFRYGGPVSSLLRFFF